ncbi:hypothetical protein [Micromonospora chokoriensis]|uniref:hypothetical protein n=1 Tax=Micromonospora chokoriensis TaxID=356851 RepID=UPI0012FDE65E|nr:hypothetical protein [Micromonospora chokoriensis]
MQDQYNHGDAYYRCRFPAGMRPRRPSRSSGNVYLRENSLTEPIDAGPATAFAPHHIRRSGDASAPALPLTGRTGRVVFRGEHAVRREVFEGASRHCAGRCRFSRRERRISPFVSVCSQDLIRSGVHVPKCSLSHTVGL